MLYPPGRLAGLRNPSHHPARVQLDANDRGLAPLHGSDEQLPMVGRNAGVDAGPLVVAPILDAYEGPPIRPERALHEVREVLLPGE